LIPPIGSIPAVGTTSATGATGATSGTGTGATGTSGTASSGGGSFDNAITDALNSVQQTQNVASTQAAQVAAGQGNIADAMIASTEASLATQVTTAVANKAIDAFTSIMNMQF
jgi:flagellar hook-basal body complex protein FliE